MVSKKRKVSDVWELRVIENGLRVVGRIYMWKPTRSVECGHRDEKKFTQCMFALICANVLFVVFLFWLSTQAVRP
jgi:hypothetical protein